MSPLDMKAIKTVVIAGRDAAAWLAANTLTRALGHTGLKVVVAELPGLLRAQDTVATLPPLEAFHRLLDFDEYAVLKAASGTYSLGQSLAGFVQGAPPFFHPYGALGMTIAERPFMAFWIKARQAGMNVALEDFSLNAAAAKQNRFFIPTDEMGQFGRLDYAYHLKAQAYVQYLKAHALRRGVEVQPVRHFDVVRDTETGCITALATGDGREIAGELFIDATGPDSLLLGEALGAGVESWARWFPGNRVLAVSGDKLQNLPPYSRIQALPSGVLHLTPLQDMTGVQYTYNNADHSDQAALETVARGAGLRLKADAVVSVLNIGRRDPWVFNCIGLGEAACVLDPIANAGLHTVQLGLAHLIDLFPVARNSAGEAREYNEQMRQALECIRDFQIAHYKLNRLEGQPLWDGLRAMEVPERLGRKIELFQARGMVALYEDETFQADDWQALFAGLGLTPETYDPVVDMTPQDTVIRSFQGILSLIRDQVREMSAHDAYLELYASRDFA